MSRAMRFVRCALCCLLLATLLTGKASADWHDFIPRPFENGAYLEFFGAHEFDDNRIENRGQSWTDIFFRERLTIFSNGYFYHPRFSQYQLSISGALKQEEFTATYIDTSQWNRRSGLEYDAKVFFLPEHPYNLELFALRREPLYKELSAAQRSSFESSRGVLFRYRKDPYFVHLKYIDDSIGSSLYTSTTHSFSADGQYFKRFENGRHFSVSGQVNPKKFSATNLEGSSNQYLFTSEWYMTKLSLYSSVSQNSFDQTSNSLTSFQNHQFTWFERLNGQLPWNLRTVVYGRYQSNTNEAAFGSGTRSLSVTGKELEFDLIHRLYDSLDTTYLLRHTSTDSTGGDTVDNSQSLTTNYTKLIPRGRLLAGINLGRSVTTASGTTAVVNEPHTAIPIPGSFLISRQDADSRSIQVFLQSPLPPNETVLLQENIHYTVAPASSTFQINIFNLPSEFVIPGTYDFFVTYTLLSGGFKLGTNSYGANLSFNLFNNFLNPYSSYSRVRAEVLSGFFPAEPIDSSTKTAGIILLRAPLRGLVEYQRFDWNVSPYRSWRGEITYSGYVTDTVTVYATLAFISKNYPLGTAFVSDSGYTDNTSSASGSIQKQFLRHLLVSAGGSYSRIRGLTDANGYSLNSSLAWKVGKLDITLGATAYGSDSESLTSLPGRRRHHYYYLNVSRKLF